MKKNCCHKLISEEEILNLLKTNGFNVTTLNKRILQEFSQNSRPMPVKDLLENLSDLQFDKSTLFRIVNKFKSKNIIKEINLNEGFFRYELQRSSSSHPQIIGEKTHHHHYVRCRHCDEIKQIPLCSLTIIEKQIHQLGFKSLEHFLEFTGVCTKCANI